MRGIARACLAFAAWSAVPLFAYTHFLHYGADGSPIPEKFNVAQASGGTVAFFVSTAGPTAYAGADNFPSVLNQIRHATQVWNGVATSALRVSFGGLYTIGTADNSPGGNVVFEQLPPGVLAYSGPTVCEDTTANGPAGCQAQAPYPGDIYLPILQSTMHMSQDLTSLPGPSSSELFFLVSVHEMGHALGLQHTFASSTMSTVTTRSTSMSDPIEADDRAGISDLYPSSSFASQYGSISGKVTYANDGSPVHMASVVAFGANAPTVSALTLEDGTYQINGVPAGQYFLYVHPLPPTADIESPTDVNGNLVAPSNPFGATLYPGVSRISQAQQVAVTAGNVSGGLNFAVNARSDVPIYDVSMYSYFSDGASDENGVHPAYVNVNANPGVIVADGVGIASGGNATSGLSVQPVGGTAQLAGSLAYTDGEGDTFLALYLTFSTLGSLGAQHLLFSTPDYLYLLPAAFHVTAQQPPTISSIASNSDGSATVAGTGFLSDSQIFFDSIAATVTGRDPNNSSITVIPPLGASGQTATLTAFNSDGQNSTFIPASPVTYAYPTVATPALSVSPSVLPAYSEAMVTITGTNTHFVQGLSGFGFGTHDATVHQVFVISPTQAIVDVGVASGAAQVTTQATELTGFELGAAASPFQLTSVQSGLPAPYPILFNGVQGQTGSYAGAIVSLYGANLQASSSATPVVQIGGVNASLLYTSANLINLQIPTSLQPGMAILTVNNGAMNSYPVAVNIDLPEPFIVNFQLSTGAALDSSRSAQPGDSIDAFMAGFPGSGSTIDLSRVQVSVGGVMLPAVSVTQVGTTPIYDVNFTLTSAVSPGTQVPVVVYIDGRSSVPATIMVAAASSN